MKQSEFLRWLRKQGVTTAEGSKHLKLYYQDKRSHLPRHPNEELSKGLVEGVKKQLGLK